MPLAFSAAPEPAEAPARPDISVCIPTIGRLEYLDKTLASLHAQTLQPAEILVLDNDSPPEAATQLQRFASNDPRVRVLRVDDRIPMFANFNRGLAAARGKYIAFFHDDDVYEPQFLERLVALMETNPGAAFAGTNYILIDGRDQIIDERRLIRRTTVLSGREYIATLARMGRNVIATPGLVFRRDAFPPSGFDTALSVHAGDYVVLMRMAEGRTVVLVEEPLYRLRQHGKNASDVPLSFFIPLQADIFGRYADEYVGRWPADARLARDIRRWAGQWHRRFLLLGWLTSSSAEESAKCLARLAEAPDPTALVRVARALGRLGIAPQSVGRHLWPVLRRIARRVGPRLTQSPRPT